MTAPTPTAPLPPAALDAMDHLELRLRFPKSVVDAVVVYETAALRAADLAAKAATGKGLPALDVRSWEFAEDLMAAAKATLVEAGRLDLIGGA
ncbi:hypothetical protein [Streptomyces acidicola]|uniref:DUF3077 domain-containing protein n=1 Tax=Streptomyces acidicola TaxID=2596892 RepID=A0A5N8WJV0_9ACTN|nr:hypothetical protein [Streptomyces acidicola]MPY47116.1 hypothetical protein [Streptomyces acidicola]MPY47255.1 hypothetical protein [Streptomyces acidicola]